MSTILAARTPSVLVPAPRKEGVGDHSRGCGPCGTRASSATRPTKATTQSKQRRAVEASATHGWI